VWLVARIPGVCMRAEGGVAPCWVARGGNVPTYRVAYTIMYRNWLLNEMPEALCYPDRQLLVLLVIGSSSPSKSLEIVV
jgi:hypothetical protein